MAFHNQNYFQKRTRPKGPRTNERIRASEVQVISSDGKNLGTLPTQEAINMAREEGLDLIEISPNANPPVCKIIDIVNFTHNKKISWHICGEGELKEEVSALRAEHSNVHFHGHIDRESMPAVYSNVDLFISTSQWGETYAYTPREANSLGIPVLSFNISGYPILN